MEFQTLTVHHYAEDPKEDKRITLAPMNITALAADVEDMTVNGRSVRAVMVLFMDGGSIAVSVNHADLQLMESAIGSFCLG